MSAETEQVQHTPGPWRVDAKSYSGGNPPMTAYTVTDRVQHRPLPWHTDGHHIHDSAGACICDVAFYWSEQDDADRTAEFIVRAVNSHDELLTALEAVLDTLNENPNAAWWLDVPSKGGFDAEAIEAAIRKARGE